MGYILEFILLKMMRWEGVRRREKEDKKWKEKKRDEGELMKGNGKIRKENERCVFLVPS